ncbi:hypothetical protein ACFWYW_57055 [Nonomuraea sp. NPDC059023]|uniref:hypothetical protein n=1 Tax=unclassified Nonomuraea TaxID=2593643 RepID=UPI0036BF49E6
MATPGRSTHGPATLLGVAGLLLFALMLVAATPAWYGSDPGHRSSDATVDVWAPGAWVSQSSTPPLPPGGPEHLPRPWPPRHPLATAPANPPALPASAWPDRDTIRSPQQSGHRTSGSRSPPTA